MKAPWTRGMAQYDAFSAPTALSSSWVSEKFQAYMPLHGGGGKHRLEAAAMLCGSDWVKSYVYEK